MIKGATENPDSIIQVTPVVKRREIPSTDDKDGSKMVTKVKAIVEFKTSQDAIDHFENIRIAFLKLGEAKATLNFHNSETNSYISLFTSGLAKTDESLNDKEFEDELVKCFRHVNKDVVQVNVFPAFNKTYVARVYLKSEESGKDFVVDFPTKREFLYKYYKDNNNIRFNINVDDKTMKRIKVMQKKAGQITLGIKNETDNLKKQNKRPGNQNPLGYMMNNMPPSMGGIGMGGMPNIPNMPPPSMGGMAPPMGNRNPPGSFMPPQMHPPQMGMGMPGMNQGMGSGLGRAVNPQTLENSIAKTIQ